MKNSISIILLTALASSCSTYTKTQCQSFDQGQLGYLGGVNGESSHVVALQRFQQDCGKEYGLVPEEEKLKQGWTQGNNYYCSEAGGSDVGLSGKKYTGVCSKENEKVFLKTYNPARLNFLEKKVIELETQLQKAQSDASFSASGLSSCESALSGLRTQISPSCI